MRRGFLNWQIVRETHTRSAHDEGPVAFWHETAVLCVPANVCSWGKSGRAADITAMTDFDRYC